MKIRRTSFLVLRCVGANVSRNGNNFEIEPVCADMSVPAPILSRELEIQLNVIADARKVVRPILNATFTLRVEQYFLRLRVNEGQKINKFFLHTILSS